MTGRQNTCSRATPLPDHIHINEQASPWRHAQTKLYVIQGVLSSGCALMTNIVIWLPWQPNNSDCIDTQQSSFIVAVEIRMWRHAQTHQQWKQVNMAIRVRINRSVTIRILYKDDDDDNNNNDGGLCGFYCLIFGFMQWSRENQHNAGLHNFLIFTKWIK